jgi:hypothetical protein
MCWMTKFRTTRTGFKWSNSAKPAQTNSYRRPGAGESFIDHTRKKGYWHMFGLNLTQRPSGDTVQVMKLIRLIYCPNSKQLGWLELILSQQYAGCNSNRMAFFCTNRNKSTVSFSRLRKVFFAVAKSLFRSCEKVCYKIALNRCKLAKRSSGKHPNTILWPRWNSLRL